MTFIEVICLSSFEDDILWLQTAVWSGDFHMEIKLHESKESPKFSWRRWKHNFSAPRPPRASSLLCVLFWTLKAWPQSGVGVRVGGLIKGQPLTRVCVLWSEPAVCRTPNGGRGWCSCIPPRSEHVRLRDGERLWEGRKKNTQPFSSFLSAWRSEDSLKLIYFKGSSSFLVQYSSCI